MHKDKSQQPINRGTRHLMILRRFTGPCERDMPTPWTAVCSEMPHRSKQRPLKSRCRTIGEAQGNVRLVPAVRSWEKTKLFLRKRMHQTNGASPHALKEPT